MGFIQKATIAAALSVPFIAGCNKEKAQQAKQPVVVNKENIPQDTKNTSREVVTVSSLKPQIVSTPKEKDFLYRLKDYADIAPGIALFDEDDKDYLTEEQAKKYVRVVIAKRKEGSFNLKELNKLDKIIRELESRSQIFYNGRFEQPENIRITINNFRRFLDSHIMSAFWAEIEQQANNHSELESQIKERKEKFYPSNKRRQQ